ncbi:hypothetical protein Q5P01_008507 [Channa striata]|uniref:Ig-like domain-containing protein n=1 Tax=Channa striata TaxID=64152 RepID=A0AA88SU43_CHASR|nr:hypothetical protein Q5P01_008507 [Channa striata]
MIGLITALILLRTVSYIETAEDSYPISLTVVEIGHSVTLHCPLSESEAKVFYLNKQPVGQMVQTVAALTLGKVTVGEQFKNSHFTVTQEKTRIFLTIRNVTKDDEATYFCQHGGTFSQTFFNGTFLAVNDHKQHKSVYVKQSSKTESVQPGYSVTLQCSLMSKSKDNGVQCPDENCVYWFRAGSEGFNSGIIYTHSINSDKQGERSCVYSLSKTIQNSSDAGTYYCAVVTCGEILVGQGTKVEINLGPELGPAVLVLGVLLGCCGVVIAALIFYIHQKKGCEHCKGSVNASGHCGHNKSTLHDLDGGDNAVNYAALNFSARRMKKGPQQCVVIYQPKF